MLNSMIEDKVKITLGAITSSVFSIYQKNKSFAVINTATIASKMTFANIFHGGELRFVYFLVSGPSKSYRLPNTSEPRQFGLFGRKTTEAEHVSIAEIRADRAENRVTVSGGGALSNLSGF